MSLMEVLRRRQRRRGAGGDEKLSEAGGPFRPEAAYCAGEEPTMPVQARNWVFI